MANLRKLALGRECLIRIPGICTMDSSTVVLCHYRMSGFSGIGMKSPDWLGAYGCSACHDVCDARSGHWGGFARESRELLLLQGVIRTLATLIDEGVIVVGGEEAKGSKVFRRVLSQ